MSRVRAEETPASRLDWGSIDSEYTPRGGVWEDGAMCGACWIDMGKPVAWSPEVDEAVKLIKRLYELEPTGGPLHVELDDWNLDGDITPMYVLPPYGETPGHPDHYSAETHDLCDRIAAILNPMKVGWRGSVLAHAEGWVVQGVPVHKF